MLDTATNTVAFVLVGIFLLAVLLSWITGDDNDDENKYDITEEHDDND